MKWVLFVIVGFVAKPTLASTGYVLNLKDAPSKTHSKGAKVEFLANPKLHQNKGIFFAKLTVPAKGKVPEHRDPTEEYLYVLSGTGKMWINNKEFNIRTGDAVYMPAEALVRFEAGPKPVEVLQVFAPAGPEKKYDSWPATKGK